MKKKSHTRLLMYVTLCCTLVFALGLMAGCSGSDGSNGATGATGPAGQTGPAGPAGGVTATGESCLICHANGQLADIAPFHPDKLTTVIDITNVVVSSPTGTPVVTFHVDSATLVSDGTTTGPRTGVAGIALTNFRPYISDLVPANTVSSPTGTSVPNLTGTLATDFFETWCAERNTTPGFSLVDLGGGNYRWTPTTGWGVPTNSGLNSADINTTVGTGHTQRLYLRISNPNTALYAKGAAAFVDFKVPANGTSATPLDSQRVMVTIQACWKCHSTTLLAAGHGGGYVDTRGCVICHSPLYSTSTAGQQAGFMANYTQDPDVEPAFNYVFPNWIHWIHSAKLGFEDVTYPQDINKCVVCHTDSGQALGTGNLIDNWKNHPTRLACGSCHNTVDFTGVSFVGLDGVSKTHPVMTNDNLCSACHPGIGAPTTPTTFDIVTVHDTTPTGKNVPEFDVTLTISNPTATTAFYSAGDAVDITATLNTHGGSAVAGSLYTSPKDTAGHAGAGLSTASLYIYGPRSGAQPLTGTQANSLFTGSTNTHVTTDSTGFRYHLVIPSGLTAGTYMLRFRAGDYGRVNDTDYKIESTAFQTFQIGTATVQKKIDGDMCVNCHGAGTAPFHDARHAVVFNSDECVACHDRSGGHADPLANRVHAIHAESAHGDLLDSVSSAMSWTFVTYPQGSMGPSSTGISTGAKICVGCNTSGNNAYKLNAPGQQNIGEACYGCHGDDFVTVDHMLQNGLQK